MSNRNVAVNIDICHDGFPQEPIIAGSVTVKIDDKHTTIISNIHDFDRVLIGGCHIYVG